MSDADRGLIFDPGTLTLGEYLDRWLADYLQPMVDQGRIEYSTYIRDAGIVRNHLKPHLGRKKLKDLNRAEVRSLYNQKAKELSPRSVDYVHATLQKALKQAVRDDLVPRNVAEGERPRSSRRKKEIKALSPLRFVRCSPPLVVPATRRSMSWPSTLDSGRASCWGSGGRTWTWRRASSL